MRNYPMPADTATRLRIFEDRASMGAAAAADVAGELRRVLEQSGRARMTFAAAPSQSEMLAALIRQPGIDWRRVTAFHLDEYLGLDAGDPARFGAWLAGAIFDALPFDAVHYIDVDSGARAGCVEYAAALAESEIDIVCLGIGVNGHLAFNDPAVADFGDPLAVKEIALDDVSRGQQVRDGCFPALEVVPRTAVTLTIPRLLSARRLFCVVPGVMKAPALRSTVLDSISTACPSTILRRHRSCIIYADASAASLLEISPAGSS